LCPLSLVRLLGSPCVSLCPFRSSDLVSTCPTGGRLSAFRSIVRTIPKHCPDTARSHSRPHSRGRPRHSGDKSEPILGLGARPKTRPCQGNLTTCNLGLPARLAGSLLARFRLRVSCVPFFPFRCAYPLQLQLYRTVIRMSSQSTRFLVISREYITRYISHKNEHTFDKPRHSTPTKREPFSLGDLALCVLLFACACNS
jgi:hypothetical protein